MYIIGLHNDIDAGVCLIKDGMILEAVNEERFRRVKLYEGCPDLSLDFVLGRYGLSLNDIDYFAYGWYGKQNDYEDYAKRLTGRIVKAMRRNPDCAGVIEERIEKEFSRDAAIREKYEEWMAGKGIVPERMVFLDHHTCHAWAAFACSPFDDALVFTFDGRGDLKSTTVSLASTRTGIEEKDYLLSFDSIGFLYGQITHYLGFTPHRHEGKVTGLAAYGDPSRTLPFFEKLMSWEDGTITAHIGPYKPFYTQIEPELIRELDRFEKNDIAAGLQAHCEDLTIRYVTTWMERLGGITRNVCLSGGVCGNVKINQRIAEAPGVDNIYVFPHMGDGGLIVGGACYLDHKLTGRKKVAMPTVFLGPSFSGDEIGESLRGFAGYLEAECQDNKVGATIGELRAGRVVGYFDGRMEFGPRALGGRSILYHARDAEVNDWLNKRLGRTEFMPFAPVTPREYASECYLGWEADDPCTPFMTRSFDCTKSFKDVHKAVVHVDGTARPQVVTEELNDDYYRIVKGYCDATGERALINTSFNRHEEPILCTPLDAVCCLLCGMVDVLIVGDYRVRRISSPATDGTEIFLRPAVEGDLETTFSWQNNDLTRRYSHNPETPTRKVHEAWFMDCLARPESNLSIIMNGQRPVGSLRLDKHDRGELNVSIIVDPDYHRRGIATAALAVARRGWPGEVFRAEIHVDNAASRTLFKACGYVEVEKELYVSRPEESA